MKEEGLPGGVSYRAATFLAITLGGLACLAIQLQLYAGNVTDAFHQGEYFSYYTAVRSGTFDGHALSLHGALDYLPAWVAHGLVGAGRYIFVTIVINGALQVAASIFFSLIAAAILRGSVHRYPLLIASALVGPLLLTSRDLLVLITTWLFIYVLTTPIAGWKKTFAEGALGVSFALGLYWSFDRGIAQTVAVGIPLVLAFLRDRRFQISILTAVVTAIALGSLVAAFSPVGYLQNIIFIAGTSSQFSYGWTRSALALTGAGLIFTIGALALLYLTARLRPPFGEPLMSLMFALLCACIFKTVSYRADFEHFPMMVWAPVLSLLFCVERLRDECGQRAVTLVALGCCAASALLVTEFWPAGPPVFIACALYVTLILSASVAPVDSERGRRQAPAHAIVLVAVIAMAHVTYQGYTRGAYGWLTRLATPPSNDAAVSGDIAWAAHALQKHDVHCVMDLSNNGAINGLLDLPSCTRFTYPVYALRTHENEMIEALRQDAVPSIIYSSTHWAYRIDSMPMSERLPKLDAFLRSEFPFEECGRAYCIRSRR